VQFCHAQVPFAVLVDSVPPLSVSGYVLCYH
jgi:hypothetical protein